MKHRVQDVAKYNRIDPAALVEFAKTNKNAWVGESGVLETSTLFVERLLDDFNNRKTVDPNT